MEKEIKVTENKVKQVLEDKVVELNSKIWEQLDALNAHMNLKAAEFFKEVLVDFPEVSVEVYKGESLYFKVDNKEILSTSQRGYDENATHYLNTYSTWIESDFEYRRLMFNGRIAALLYNKGWETALKEFFVPDEFMVEYKKQRGILDDEKWELEREIARINKEQQEASKKETLKKMLAGEVAYLIDPVTMYYKSGKYDYVRGVQSFQVVGTNSTGKKVDIEFTNQWGTGTVKEIPLKNIDQYLNNNIYFI